MIWLRVIANKTDSGDVHKEIVILADNARGRRDAEARVQCLWLFVDRMCIVFEARTESPKVKNQCC